MSGLVAVDEIQVRCGSMSAVNRLSLSEHIRKVLCGKSG